MYTYYGHKERIPDILKEKHPETRVVIVDDGYPEPLEVLEGIDVYRILEDIPWNMPGAKNLGFHVSEGWIICADIDHLVTRENIDEILKLEKVRGRIYFLGRKDVITGDESHHCGEFLIHKDDFELVGGYDEEFSGYYGHDDTLFVYQCQKNLVVEDIRYIKTKLFDDSYTKGVSRDSAHNYKIFERKQFSQRNEGKRLNFNWKFVEGD